MFGFKSINLMPTKLLIPKTPLIGQGDYKNKIKLKEYLTRVFLVALRKANVVETKKIITIH